MTEQDNRWLELSESPDLDDEIDWNSETDRKIWRTVRAIEFARANLESSEVDRALDRLEESGVVRSTGSNLPKVSIRGVWTEARKRVKAVLQTDLAGPLPSLRSAGTAELFIFGTDQYVVSIRAHQSGAMGSILPRLASELPSGGILRHYEGEKLIAEHSIAASGHFLLEDVNTGDHLEIQIGDEWIEIPPIESSD